MLMRVLTGVAVALASSPTAAASSACRVLPAHGVRLAVPTGLERVLSAGDGPAIDPKTLLVVGTSGVHPRSSQCQIASYSILRPELSSSSSAGRPRPPPAAISSPAARRSRRCGQCAARASSASTGAVAQVALDGKAYQINVMVGDRPGT
jgi:hypothetical protein